MLKKNRLTIFLLIIFCLSFFIGYKVLATTCGTTGTTDGATTKKAWGNTAVMNNGITSDDGAYNIFPDYSQPTATTFSAFDACYNLEGTSSSWYLPSISDLTKVSANYQYLLKANAGINANFYWSSNQNGSTNGRSINISTGATGDRVKTSASNNSVRCMKKVACTPLSQSSVCNGNIYGWYPDGCGEGYNCSCPTDPATKKTTPNPLNHTCVECLESENVGNTNPKCVTGYKCSNTNVCTCIENTLSDAEICASRGFQCGNAVVTICGGTMSRTIECGNTGLDDGNVCTTDTCTNHIITHTNVDYGVACAKCKVCNNGGCENVAKGAVDLWTGADKCNNVSSCKLNTCDGNGECQTVIAGQKGNCPECGRCNTLGSCVVTNSTNTKGDECGGVTNSCRVCSGISMGDSNLDPNVCTKQGDGLTPVATKNPCTGINCNNIIKGWNNNACEKYSGANLKNATCNGTTGLCYGASNNDYLAVCTGATTHLACGSAGCKKSCTQGLLASAYPLLSDVCYTSGTHDCNWSEKCNASGTCYESFVCGTDTITYAGQTYSTLLANGKCWFGQNLNVGSEILANNAFPTDPYFDGSNTNTIQKWCYNNDASYCNSDGGLYTQAEALALPASCINSSSGICSVSSARRGICPSGWHIPSDCEFLEMARSFDSSLPIPNPGTNCAGHGSSLSYNSSWLGNININNGFLPNFSGRLIGTSPWYIDRGNNGLFVTSSFATNGFRSGFIFQTFAPVFTRFSGGAGGYSVRCIRDY